MRMPEVRTLPIAEMEIPPDLARLRDLAYNLWWTWTPRARQLFEAIDPVRWHHYHSPVELLINVEPRRWEPLLKDASFLAEYRAVIDALDRYLAGSAAAWFPRTYPDFQGGPIAYFSTEYGWHEALGIYSGGLGVLSGDHCKSASDLGLPFVGVGLLYARGYFQQTIDADGQQQHAYPRYDLGRLPVQPVAGPGGREVKIELELAGRTVRLRLWKATVGRVPVILLDSDVRENDPADRFITSFLYVRGREMRLCQELVLGMGGVVALRTLGFQPSVWHMNEGHSAFLSLQRIRERVRRDGISFAEARRRISGNAVFTTHTPVPAGNEMFDAALVRRYMAPLATEVGATLDEVLDLGRAGEGADLFNLTALAIRTSGQANGVSVLHGEVASRMWRGLYPPEAGAQPIGAVTNGVHTLTWIGPEILDLLRRRLGDDFQEHMLDVPFAEAVAAIPDEEVWAAHLAQKRRLVTFARERVLEQFARHGRSPDELRAVQGLLDPEILTLGFARRFATYKRADLLFRDPARLHEILSDPQRPVQVLFAGKAHPADRPGQELIRRIFESSLSPQFRGRILFLENYDLRIARFLVQGVDVWLNNPRRPEEASGTSGMKAAVNGALNFSVLDGWWQEGFDATHGWAIGRPVDYSDTAEQDREDTASLLATLSGEIVPAYYRRDAAGLPRDWVARMKAAVGLLGPRFSTHRMVREYTSLLYVPASARQGWGTDLDEVRLWSA
ncbi:MAG TPA: alpha-glucan family phosphorylase [Candidatus Polarisedimenticolaceae bacterium]|nr:alpha-glucan family phosphorylase [Candidatus Polarisedimenticolaceae bacterium]